SNLHTRQDIFESAAIFRFQPPREWDSGLEGATASPVRAGRQLLLLRALYSTDILPLTKLYMLLPSLHWSYFNPLQFSFNISIFDRFTFVVQFLSFRQGNLHFGQLPVIDKNPDRNYGIPLILHPFLHLL